VHRLGVGPAAGYLGAWPPDQRPQSEPERVRPVRPGLGSIGIGTCRIRQDRVGRVLGPGLVLYVVIEVAFVLQRHFALE